MLDFKEVFVSTVWSTDEEVFVTQGLHSMELQAVPLVSPLDEVTHTRAGTAGRKVWSSGLALARRKQAVAPVERKEDEEMLESLWCPGRDDFFKLISSRPQTQRWWEEPGKSLIWVGGHKCVNCVTVPYTTSHVAPQAYRKAGFTFAKICCSEYMSSPPL